jgi:hypothetical protein
MPLPRRPTTKTRAFALLEETSGLIKRGPGGFLSAVVLATSSVLLVMRAAAVAFSEPV